MRESVDTRRSEDLSAQDAQLRQEATREILQAISRSRGDYGPVFDMLLENAARLCDAPLTLILLANADRTHLELAGARRGVSPAYVEFYEKTPIPLDSATSVAARSVLTREVLQLEDAKDSTLYSEGNPHRARAVDIEGMRTLLVVPLISDGKGIGCLGLWRREVKPFEDSSIVLVKTFAEQAVIAIENVRQFRAMQSRLEREAATGEILSIISRSRDDEEPVFDTILRNALRLCDVDMSVLALVNEERTHLELTASAGAKFVKLKPGVDRWPIESDLTVARAVRERRNVVTDDLRDDELYRQGDPTRVALVEKEGMRSQLVIPLMSGERAIGSFVLQRRKKRSFMQDEITLLQSFAAQAVIAIENVRQFREIQSRLEREAATRAILEVISRSRDDEGPVFDAILSNAQRLCGAPFSFLAMVTGDKAHVEIMAEGSDPFEPFRPGWRWPIDSVLLVARSVREKAVLQIEDTAQDPLYEQGNKDRITVVEAGVRTVLTVPLVTGGVGIGSIALFRREPRPFTPDEIALVQTFAEQAIIAIENVQQFKALESLNAELSDRVEDQVGEIERMGRLKRFLPTAVADTIVSRGSETVLSSHRALLGVLFCDIRGFTAFCETAEPEETIEVLQTYHEEMGKLVNSHGAGVDHRMGDGIMVLFNDPLPCDDPAGEAVRLAIAMRERMAELGAQWKRLGYRLGFGVGVSLGYATVGMVGFEGRFDYTASGTAINVAARLCDEAEDGEILLSPRAGIAVEDAYRLESRGEINLKGIREPLEVFRLSGVAVA